MSNTKPQKTMMFGSAVVISVLIWWLPSTEGCWLDDGNMNSQFHLNLHKVSHFSFFPGNPKWPTPSKYSLTYSFPKGFPSNGIPVMNQAFNKWATRTPFTFTQVANNAASDLKISFETGNHGDGAPFDGKGGTLAHAFSPQNGRLHFDGNDSFSIGNPVPTMVDFETVAVHEIGHLLGLGHSNDQQAVMYAFISPGTVKATPQADDINGLKTLYGFS